MTSPASQPATNGMLAQVLAEQRKIRKQLKAIPDHEARLRRLEQFLADLAALGKPGDPLQG